MRVVLLEDVPSLGQKYDIKEVANGYARNFLLPKGYAHMATQAMVARFANAKKKSDELSAIRVKELESYLEKLSGVTVTLSGKANEKGHLFAKIHEKEIADALSVQADMPVDAAFIVLDAPISEVGEHDIKVKVNEKEGDFKLVVESEK
ncbi:MAG: 50S ribosomal protein L9 [Candidatus Lloydbacteria bacterium CG22_combo_CG10-13_8_21_14_all_47_15]|uniref:Large ribosomal subunit protein bL9 n=1 Tax=Candidatus Lloydbacteria bacterium CG22_combo_CG10-13_8_21_14_all_47_15 TaxID=1974635 RepID=A0A2H0CU02_9BACT|nr:MAG: 50S ribosomal protein L9 [Candidatus Lloydbacteria bacterium CG22_combo_CG10-13_8_21_14_all_47_15]